MKGDMEGAATKRPQEVWPTLSVVGWLFREGIQRQVQFQNVDPRLSEEAPLSSLSLPGHDGPHRRFAHAARFGDARHLELGGGRRDLGSKPEAEVVTISTGTGLPGFSAWAAATSAFTRSMSF